MKYEIQQDNANCWRVISTDSHGTRRACDNPPCKTRTEAEQMIAQLEINAEGPSRGND